jgi:Protein of unknown function (DUF992)
VKSLSHFFVAYFCLMSSLSFAVHAQGSRPTREQRGVQVGILSCDTVPGSGTNWIVRSTVDLTCIFDGPWGSERYRGESGIALGVDLKFNRREKIAFAVIAAASDIRSRTHALAGRYYGGKASATLIYGVGAAALIGGGAKNVALQPLAVESSTGFGLSGGVGY